LGATADRSLESPFYKSNKVVLHKKVETTMIYTRLYKQIYKNQQPNQFITKIASTKEERVELMNDGWNLVDKDGIDWYFSKPKLS